MLPHASSDVVEVLLEEHVAARTFVALAQRLCSAPSGPSTAALAAQVSAYFSAGLERHFIDEERSIAPRLAGRNPVVDGALQALEREHPALRALAARVSFLCRLVARDVSRLLSLRFELASACESLERALARHHEREESLVFPALRRLLDFEDVAELAEEVFARRDAALALAL